MMLNDLWRPGWGDVAEYFHERDKEYVMSELQVLAVIEPHTEHDAVASPPISFGQLLETLDKEHGIWQMLQVGSRPGTCLMGLGSQKCQSHTLIVILPPVAVPIWLSIMR